MGTPHWQLCTYATPDGRPRTGALSGRWERRGAPRSSCDSRGLVDLLADWPDVEGQLQAWDPAGAVPAEEVTFARPILYPAKLICTGANYRKHLEEMGPKLGDDRTPEDRLGSDWRPFFFLKPPTTTVRGHDQEIAIDASDEGRNRLEAELAVVIGLGGRTSFPTRRWRTLPLLRYQRHQ